MPYTSKLIDGALVVSEVLNHNLRVHLEPNESKWDVGFNIVTEKGNHAHCTIGSGKVSHKIKRIVALDLIERGFITISFERERGGKRHVYKLADLVKS